MMIALSAVSLVLGTAIACAAERVPAHVKLMESGGGALLVAGLALIGFALPHVP